MNQIIFGFDFGLSKIGVAVGQTLTKTATPVTVLNAKKGEPDWQQIAALIRTWQPQALVVGIPRKVDGSKLYVTEHAEQFAQKLSQQFSLPVHTIGECYTTKLARSEVFEKKGSRGLERKIDHVAAKIILESWLNAHS